MREMNRRKNPQQKVPENEDVEAAFFGCFGRMLCITFHHLAEKRRAFNVQLAVWAALTVVVVVECELQLEL